jgi:dihydroorotate dehydrogenase
MRSRLASRPRAVPADGFVVGVNIGRNRDGDLDDYARAARSVAAVADYLAINVSSPNTPGLRDLQEPSTLRNLLGAVRAAAPVRPILVKLAPDLEPAVRSSLVEAAVGAGAAGVIGSNSTTARVGLRSPAATEAGGLSGPPPARARARDRGGVARVGRRPGRHRIGPGSGAARTPGRSSMRARTSCSCGRA